MTRQEAVIFLEEELRILKDFADDCLERGRINEWDSVRLRIASFYKLIDFLKQNDTKKCSWCGKSISIPIKFVRGSIDDHQGQDRVFCSQKCMDNFPKYGETF